MVTDTCVTTKQHGCYDRSREPQVVYSACIEAQNGTRIVDFTIKGLKILMLAPDDST